MLLLALYCLTAVKYGVLTNVKILKKIHLKFLKLLLGVKKSTSSMAVYGETGRYPLYINRYVRMVKYWGNVLKTDNIIMKTMYNDMLEKQKMDKKTGRVK